MSTQAMVGTTLTATGFVRRYRALPEPRWEELTQQCCLSCCPATDSSFGRYGAGQRGPHRSTCLRGLRVYKVERRDR